MRKDWDVTYEIITPESAEEGDAEESGFIREKCTLREAVATVFETRTSHCDTVMAIETDSSPFAGARWVTVYNGKEYLTGAYENRSLHIPARVTQASRVRLARLLGAV